MARAQRLQDENATLHESNTMLRSENGRLRREVEELRKQLALLQQERVPMLKQIRCARQPAGLQLWPCWHTPRPCAWLALVPPQAVLCCWLVLAAGATTRHAPP
jgi:hypothetical protein